MKEILFKLGLFQYLDQAASERVMHALLDSLLLADIEYLRAHPDTPRIYQAGVHYEREPLPSELAQRFPQCKSPCAPEIHPEEWKIIPECIRDRQADCEDLATWVCAERIVKDNIPARVDFSFRRIGDFSIYHIFCRLPDGSIEDPSARLGMVKT